ncbi:MAG: hypothetical protein AAF849_23250 [Bacteroidota bacterium]
MIEILLGCCCLIGGVLFIGKVWGKIRPMIEIEDEEGTYHAGISHSEKEGMIPMQQEDLKEGSSFEIDQDTYAGLSNKSQLKMKYDELGETTDEFDQRLLDANSKLRDKARKRKKKK